MGDGHQICPARRRHGSTQRPFDEGRGSDAAARCHVGINKIQRRLRAQYGAAEVNEDQDAIGVIGGINSSHDAHGVGADGVIGIVDTGGSVDSGGIGAHLRREFGQRLRECGMMRDEDEVDHDVSGSVFSVGIIRAKPQLSTHQAVCKHTTGGELHKIPPPA